MVFDKENDANAKMIAWAGSRGLNRMARNWSTKGPWIFTR